MKYWKKFFIVGTGLFFIPNLVMAASLKVGEKEFDTFTEAITEAIEAEENIMVQENIENQKIVVQKDQNIKIYLGVHTLSYSDSETSENAIENFGTLEINGVDDSKIQMGKNQKVVNHENANLTLKIGNYEALNSDVNNTESSIINQGNFAIVDGNFKFSTNIGIDNSNQLNITYGNFTSDCEKMIVTSSGNTTPIITVDEAAFNNTSNRLLSFFQLNTPTELSIHNGQYVDNVENSNAHFILSSAGNQNVSLNDLNISMQNTILQFNSESEKVTLSIDGGIYQSTHEIIYSNSPISVTIGNKDEEVEEFPKFVTKEKDYAMYFPQEYESTLKFYDGSFTALKNPPFLKQEKTNFDTLESYNVKEDEIGYTANLVKTSTSVDPPDEDNPEPPKEESNPPKEETDPPKDEDPSSDVNPDEDKGEVTEETNPNDSESKEDIENPNTGNFDVLPTLSLLILCVVLISIFIRKNRFYKL